MRPIRCMNCGKLLGDKFEEFDKRTREKKEPPGKVLDDLGIKRYCCRITMLTSVDLSSELAKYKK